jgi:hypothetical protein
VGYQSHVTERFGSAGVSAEQIQFERATYTFNYNGSPSAFVSAFRNYYGPAMNAFEAAEKDGKADGLQTGFRRFVQGLRTKVPVLLKRVFRQPF